ncbi:MAG: hypothetical protein HY238_11785 [Acidobacteria bacterium]|nr:hypothetical protein [Acidobacteriota bacterium]
MTVKARISPAFVGSGYFAVIFLIDGKENSVAPRDTLPFAPGTSYLGSPRTASDGTYSLAFPPEPVGSFRLRASFASSDTLWPAFASVPFGDTPTINANGIVNAASFQVEPLSPGAWFTIFGQNLGAAGQWADPSTTTLLRLAKYIDGCADVAHALLRAAPRLVSASAGCGTRVETSLDPAS